MTSSRLTHLELALMAKFQDLYKSEGFPSPDAFRVRHRENTGSGRYVDLECDEPVTFEDGDLDLAGGFIDMLGIRDGLMALVLVEAHRVRQLEIAVYGTEHWDGEERAWKIVAAS